jgi:hypothetical protein
MPITWTQVTQADFSLGQARGPLLTETHFHVGAFDRAAELQPTRHVFPEERSPWLPTGD